VLVGTAADPEVVDVDVDERAGVSLVAACAGPASRPDTVTAVGVDDAGRGVVAIVDPVAATVEVAPAPLDLAPIGCAAIDDETVVVGADAAIAIGDDTSPRPLDVLRRGERITAIAAGPSGPAVVGTTADGDGFLLLGPTLARVRVPDMVGPGTHVPTGVVVRTDDVVVLGLADGAPATWVVAAAG